MNKTIKKISHLFCVAVVATFCQSVMAADSDGGLQVGVLKCSVVPGSRVNLIIRSTADVVCEFNNNGTIEKYKGETGIGLGLDLSFKSDEQIAFSVISASSDTTAGSYALAGKYVGGELSAAVGVGLGAKALVGVSEQSFNLQPLALESSKGLGISGGLGFLYIEADK
jgi:uncharacterized protein DUF992